MDITNHSIWKSITPYKKPLHLLRIQLAKQYAKLYPQEMFVGVTGSVGKTTTVNACKAVLSQKFINICKLPVKKSAGHILF